MSLHTTPLLIALGLGLCPALAVAQAAGGYEIFNAADANRDGQVSRSEFENLRNERFEERDRNNDGYLSRADMGAFANGPRAQQALERLAEIDLDGDARVSRDEFAVQGRRQFETADRDQSGLVSPAEIDALAR